MTPRDNINKPSELNSSIIYADVQNEEKEDKEDLIEKEGLQNTVEEDAPLLVKNPHTLRVATYNILTSFSYLPKKNDSQENYQLSWEFRKNLIIEMIEKLDPDILGLQEVSLEQFHFIKDRLKGFGMIGFAAYTGHALNDIAPDEYVGEIVPILYKKETIECRDSKVFWLSSTPNQPSKGWDASRPRILTCGAFISKLDGNEFVAGNTHYDHLGDEALVNSGKVEAELLEKYRVEHNVPTFISLGDRNCFTDEGRAGNKWYKTFKKESGAKDTRLCGKHFGLNTTFLGYHPDNFKAPYDADLGRFKPSTIDLIFHKGKQYKVESSKCSAGEYEVKKEGGGARLLGFFGKVKAPEKRQFVSDHCILMADLEKVTHQEDKASPQSTFSTARSTFFVEENRPIKNPSGNTHLWPYTSKKYLSINLEDELRPNSIYYP